MTFLFVAVYHQGIKIQKRNAPVLFSRYQSDCTSYLQCQPAGTMAVLFKSKEQELYSVQLGTVLSRMDLQRGTIELSHAAKQHTLRKKFSSWDPDTENSKH